MRRFATMILASLLLACPAAAQEVAPEFTELMNEADEARIARFDEALGQALIQAVKAGAFEDIETLQQAIGGEAQPTSAEGLIGDWRCRTIKIGGNLPLVAYGFFDCRIERVTGGLSLQKLSGSQRTSGRLVSLDGSRWGYVGADHYAREDPIAYDANSERNTVGILSRVGRDRLWLGMPEPQFESDFDVLELVRAR
ncbi:DUF4893 domain-containing protein [Lutibaculum baratangense]|uniref:DUF4893 domain-containing protein n=1 Tax=Lutibaculum baratangense AMV1 TaxID=631454 RepID=V4RM62_9HYPH|nr:DUF4893 domain-containing protein [Lutibaculum baratangense]ESR26369.1 hypothetical protein N177_0869 [Lutibaculum baratangense AMV1]